LQKTNKLILTTSKKLESFIFKTKQRFRHSIFSDSYWFENKLLSVSIVLKKTDTGLLTNYIQDIIDNASTHKSKSKGGYKLGFQKPEK
jgi:hypothetical protein